MKCLLRLLSSSLLLFLPFCVQASEPDVYAGVATSFSGKSSPGVLYEWSFPGNKKMTGPEVQYTFTDSGQFEVTLKVTKGKQTNQVTKLLTVGRNNFPVGKIQANKTAGMVKEPFQFFADYTDGDKDPLKYQWIIEAAFTKKKETLSGANAESLTHQFAAPGRYRVILKVADGKISKMDKNPAESSIYVNVVEAKDKTPAKPANRPPVAKIYHVSPKSGTTKTAFRVYANGTDPDGDRLNYHWVLSDGAEYDQKNIAHRFEAAGSYDIEVQVSDGTVSTSDVTTINVIEEVLETVAIPGDEEEGPMHSSGGFNEVILVDQLLAYRAQIEGFIQAGLPPTQKRMALEDQQVVDEILRPFGVSAARKQLATSDNLNLALAGQQVELLKQAKQAELATTTYSTAKISLENYLLNIEKLLQLFARDNPPLSAATVQISAPQPSMDEMGDQLETIKDQKQDELREAQEAGDLDAMAELEDELREIDTQLAEVEENENKNLDLKKNQLANEKDNLEAKKEELVAKGAPPEEIEKVEEVIEAAKKDLEMLENKIQERRELCENPLSVNPNFLKKQLDQQLIIRKNQIKKSEDYYERTKLENEFRQIQAQIDGLFTANLLTDSCFDSSEINSVILKRILDQIKADKLALIETSDDPRVRKRLEGEVTRLDEQISRLQQIMEFVQIDFEANVHTTIFLYGILEQKGEAPVLFEWDLGDGRIKTAQNVSFRYPDPGLYQITISASDGLTEIGDTIIMKIVEGGTSE